MSRFKLEFKLKQHTPMIHFQGDQYGATLRATELKPKLDKFLIEKLELTEIKKIKGKNKEVPKEVYKSWFIGGGSEYLALDYKVRISAINKQSFPVLYKYENIRGEIVSNNFPTFFAEMGEDAKKHMFSMSKGVIVTIAVFVESLYEVLRSHFGEFIFLHNFGMRQSKGFGSFDLVEINGEKTQRQVYGNYKFSTNTSKKYKNSDNPHRFYRYVDIKPKESYLEFIKLFDAINRFHQILRSGINENDFYIKPFIFFYAQKNNITWDKRTFKQKFLSKRAISKQQQKHNASGTDPLLYVGSNDEPLLVRDWLGLSTNQLWKKPPNNNPEYEGYGFTVRHPKDTQDTNKQDTFSDNSIPPNPIKRFKSPITYKPINKGNGNYDIYIVLSDLPEELIRENAPKFTMLKEDNDEITDVIDNMLFWQDFDLSEFMEDVYGDRNIITQKSNEETHKLLSYISGLYSSLKRIPDEH